MVFPVSCDLRASADWRALADELLAREEPRRVLSIEHKEWVEAKRG